MDKTLSKINQMETYSIPKLIAKYSVTTFCALFFNELYNIVDTLFVSRGVGDNAMGGVSIIFPFVMIQGAVSQTIGAGSASIISRLLGKKDYEQAGSVTANAMCAFYITAAAITVIGLTFINPLLNLFGATDDIMPYAKAYFTIMLLGNVFSTGFSSIIRAEGKMVYSLLIWLIPTAINVLLDAVFIYGLHMGVKGAALATVISYFSSFVMSIIFFTKLSVQRFSHIKLKLKTVTEIITLGVPMLIQMGSMSILFAVVNKMLSASGGTLVINTFAYLSRIITFSIVPFTSMAMAVSPIISYNFGAERNNRVNKALKYCVIFSEAYAVFAMIAAFLFPQIFLKIFTSDTGIILSGVNALHIISPSLLFVPVTIITGSYFQAIGKKASSALANSLILIFLAVNIFILSKRMGINEIWLSIPVSCLLACIVSIILIKARGINVIAGKGIGTGV